jgi:hypothetical protein
MEREAVRRLLVYPGIHDRTLTLGQVAAGAYVVLDGDRQLGEVWGDLTPLCLGSSHIVLAGPIPEERAHHVVVDFPHNTRICPIHSRVWMSFPEPFTEGIRIRASWRDKDDQELFQLESPPLRRNALQPMFGPRWKGYAPLSDS